jgi:hypothetical protein
MNLKKIYQDLKSKVKTKTSKTKFTIPPSYIEDGYIITNYENGYRVRSVFEIESIVADFLLGATNIFPVEEISTNFDSEKQKTYLVLIKKADSKEEGKKWLKLALDYVDVFCKSKDLKYTNITGEYLLMLEEKVKIGHFLNLQSI